MLQPQKITKNEQESLTITWKDGRIHTIPLRFLRDESPDAGNKGETILWTHYPAEPQGPDKPGKYEIKNIQVVGSYAIQITWGDNYDHGIYPWDLLEKWGEFWEMKNELKKDK
jgi:DUF971 family protein